MSASALTPALAESFARIALDNVVREFPGKPDHVLATAADAQPPHALHPAFYGSFDWHSCVHMHWLLVRVRRLFPALGARSAIDAVLDRHLAPANIEAECAYLAREHARTFERTYGWAWLLELAHELARGKDTECGRWRAALAPLAHAIVARYLDYLPRQRYPLRHGLHANSAFGLAFALDYARAANLRELTQCCEEAAVRWFAHDRDAPARWEPSGADFLSPALVEADVMRRILPAAAFARWLEAFLPGLAAGELLALLVPVPVDDRADPFLVHLDGLNLSRAWSMRCIAGALPERDPRRAVLEASAETHLACGMRGIGTGDYAGGHWLATFAVLACTAGTGPGC